MTSQIRLSGLNKTFGTNTVVDQLDLEVGDGEFLVLLGPSGCGKTATLRCIAGLETPEGGSITFKHHTVFDASRRTNVPPHKRNIGMVFQSYALWPNMTVRENILYPLKVRRMKEEIKGGQVERAAEMVDCGALLDRYPSQLSGGQQQRVAVARGLVARPDVVLFDEPLSNLDARLRNQVRTEIHQLHKRLGFTAVFVTHDQSEAFALGDRLAIMRAGKIEQLDTPERVFEQPASDYVAAFIGMENRLELVRGHHGWMTATGVRLDLTSIAAQGNAAVARLRPDDLVLHRSLDEVRPGDIGISGELLTSEYGGRHYDVTVQAGGERLHVRAEANVHAGWLADAAEGAALAVSFPPQTLRLFPHPGEPAADPELERAAAYVEV